MHGIVLANRRLLRREQRQQRVGRESVEVEDKSWLGGGAVGSRSGWLNLGPVGVAHAPHCGSPGVVQCVEGGVALREPVAERLRTVVAVAGWGVAAVLVVDMPHDHGRVCPEPRGQPTGEPDRAQPIVVRVRAERLPATGPAHGPGPVDWKDVGMRTGQPGRGRSGRGGEVDADARLVQVVEQGLHPVEVELAVAGLEHRPGEDTEGDEVDARLAHEADVFGPRLRRPLLRVVVAAEQQPWYVGPGHSARVTEMSIDASGRRIGGCRPTEPRIRPVTGTPPVHGGGAICWVSGAPPGCTSRTM